MDIYLNPERFNNIKEVRIVKQRIKTGKEVAKLLLKYFRRDFTGKGKNKVFKPPNNYFSLYNEWQDKVMGNIGTAEEWKEELDNDYDEYYDKLDSIYITIGKNVYSNIKDLLKPLSTIELRSKSKRKVFTPKTIKETFEMVGGRAFIDFEYGMSFIEAYRKFGMEIWKLIEKLWPDELRKKGHVKKGGVLEYGDFHNWLTQYKKRNPTATIKQMKTAIETQFVKRSQDKWLTDEYQLLLRFSNVAKQVIFTQLPAIIKLLS